MRDRDHQQAFGIQHPIVLAPLAGGPSTPELVAAVSNAGGLGSLGAAYMTPSAIRDAIATIRRLTDRPFAINLFVPEPAAPDASRLAEVQSRLSAYRAELGLPEPRLPDPLVIPFEDQLAAIVEAKVSMCSFTFGVPAAEVVRALRQAGSLVVGTATHVEEACVLERAGVDAIVAQGGEAGGHRGTFLGRADDALIGTMALVPQVVDAVRVPVIAAGGIMDGRGIVAALALGACAAQLGTAFLCCDETGTDEAYRRSLVESHDNSSTITRAFSGRAARGLRNRFVDDWETFEPAPFPLQNVLTADIRAAARRAGRPELVNLWAGQGSPKVRRMPAAELMRALVDEMAAARRNAG
ncbi:NAD(P)H-dependent flavin oxidoreductase [Polyangium aurulentum]|uniref:NAD(P)H-dependent flavin oxidoreductase n=1 Tax=Polyangium aurulentum TaxID=2567896 RepID=UPI0010AEE42F|nr:nitronate monooxygenase [Polyangium aurulentum]UQA59797.1 nitronate monooxygenase [Polyangium aurulentum]